MFYRHKGGALDGSERVLVSDSYPDVLQLFDVHGRFLGGVGGPATGKLKRFETTRNRVRVYHLDGAAR